MTVAFVENTTTATGTTSLSLTPGGGSTENSISFLTVGCKPYNAVVTAPSGWNLLTTGTNGTTVSGADTGSTQINLYYKLGDIGVDAVSVVTTGGASNVIEGTITTWSKASNEVWDFEQFTVSQDTSNGANITAVGAANISLATGDYILSSFYANADLGSAASIAVTAASATLGSYVATNNTATTNGDDGLFITGYNSVTAGASSAAPQETYTNASNSSGTGVFMRVRAVTLTIAVAFNSDSDTNPAIEITLANVPTYANLQITRATTTGEYPLTGVRGYDDITPLTDSIVAVDFEAPLDQDLQYTVNVLSNDVVIATVDASATINLLSDVGDGSPLEYFHLAFLKSVSQPALNKRIALRDFTTWAHSGRVLGNFQVLGRANPVVLTDVLGGRTGTFSFWTWDPEVLVDTELEQDWGATFASIRDLLSEGDTLLFQTTSGFTGQDMYLKVENVSVSRANKPPTLVGTTLEHKPLLAWDIQFVEVDQPSTTGVDATFATWQAVLDDPDYNDWNGVLAFGTWLDVLQEYS